MAGEVAPPLLAIHTQLLADLESPIKESGYPALDDLASLVLSTKLRCSLLPFCCPCPEHADLHQIAAELLPLAGSPASIQSPTFKSASFHKTDLIWYNLGRLDLAAACLEASLAQIDGNLLTGGENKRLLLDLNLAWARTTWAAMDWTLVITMFVC